MKILVMSSLSCLGMQDYVEKGDVDRKLSNSNLNCSFNTSDSHSEIPFSFICIDVQAREKSRY
jgi:hypothetical protein